MWLPKMANSDIGVGKSIAVLAIVVGCFTVLWPKVFYPMMQAAFSKTQHEGLDGSVPGRPAAQSHLPGQAHSPEYSRGRPFPHPSMRQPPRQAAKTGGAMNLVMPLYTIGVVVFFLYTVLKLVCKKSPQADTSRQEPFGSCGPAASVSPSHRVHPAETSGQPQSAQGEVEELKRRLATTEALLQRLLARQSSVAQPGGLNMGQSLNLLVRELTRSPQHRTQQVDAKEGLRHRRHARPKGEARCPCGAPLESCSQGGSQGGSQADSCSEGTAESGDEASPPMSATPDRATKCSL